MSAADVTADVEEFIFEEAALADARRYKEWLELWEPDGIYWVPINTEGEYVMGRTLSILRDDRARLDERIRRLQNPAVHSQVPASKVTRLVTNVRVEPATPEVGGVLTATSRVLIDEVRRGEQELYTGAVEHRLRRRPDGWGIVAKTVRLTRAEMPLGNLTFLL